MIDIETCRVDTGTLHVEHFSACYFARMFITDEEAKEFGQRYKKVFGEQLSIPEAREVASNLCELYLILLSPTSSEQKAMEEKAAKEATLMQLSSQFPDIHSPP